MKRNKGKLSIILLLFITVLLIACIHQRNPNSDKEKKYLKIINVSGEWFLNNQDESFLHYEYDYLKKIHPKKSHALREMGALWSITKLSSFLKDEKYDVLAKRGFNYFEKYFVYDKENNFLFVNVTPSKVKLGYSAFMTLSLLEIDHPKKEEYLEKFANSILFQQNESGKLSTFFYSERETGQDYYPGEALLALMSLYEHTKDEKYLDAVIKAFPFYVNYFKENPNTAFIPWQTRAYYKLYIATHDEDVAEFLFEMNDFMINEHNPKEYCKDFDFSKGITTAVYLEGVIKAYNLANERDDEKRTSCYFNFIEEALNQIASLQITESIDKKARGGFLGSKTSQTMRVDRNQHAAMALMDAYELGILK